MTDDDNPWKANNGHSLFHELAMSKDIWLDFHPKVEAMMTLYRTTVHDHPRQCQMAATFAAGNPSLEWVLAQRRRTFQLLALQYACLTEDMKDEFCDEIVGWWKEVRANEDRAEATIVEYRRREMAS
jgi:predicted deacylase